MIYVLVHSLSDMIFAIIIFITIKRIGICSIHCLQWIVGVTPKGEFENNFFWSYISVWTPGHSIRLPFILSPLIV